MSTKVVHLPEDVHRYAKEHCETNGTTMTQWVSELIRKAVGNGDGKNNVRSTETVYVPEPDPVELVPVEKGKKLRDLADNNVNDETSAESLPPFWVGRQSQE